MKKSLVTIIVLIITVVGLGVTLMLTSCSMRSLTGLFFNVNLEPVAIDVKDSYELRTADEKTKMIVEAANAFINSLDKIQKQTITYKFSDNAQRSNWSNFPEGHDTSWGLRLRSFIKETTHPFGNSLISNNESQRHGKFELSVSR